MFSNDYERNDYYSYSSNGMSPGPPSSSLFDNEVGKNGAFANCRNYQDTDQRELPDIEDLRHDNFIHHVEDFGNEIRSHEFDILTGSSKWK